MLKLIPDNIYIDRCLRLARLGFGSVAPNPLVGAVLVYEDRIIGEGYHRQFGGPHAEVNCIDSVQIKDINLVAHSTLFVSLEPCAHFGKTPPCTDLVIKNKIPKVVIGCRDPFKEVNGKGIEKLKEAGVDVHLIGGETELACKQLNKRFFIFHQQQRPYVILKWAQTGNGLIGNPTSPPAPTSTSPPAPLLEERGEASRLLISNEFSNRMVHKWRSEEQSILVGTNTALMDDPQLTNRLWPGQSPIRLVMDMDLKLPAYLKLFDGVSATIVFNSLKHDMTGVSMNMNGKSGIGYYQVNREQPVIFQLLQALYNLQIQSVLVEGGAKLLQSFIDEGIWDEARIITANAVRVQGGVKAPQLRECKKNTEQFFLDDKVEFFER